MNPKLPDLGLDYAVACHDRDGNLLWSAEAHNLVPIEGFNHALGVLLEGVTPITTWYIGLIESDYTPLSTVTAATLQGLATECLTYTPSTRVEYVGGAIANGNNDNSANLAVFTSTADKTIYDLFLAGSPTKGSTSSVLLSVVRLPSPYPFPNGSILRVQASPTISAPA